MVLSHSKTRQVIILLAHFILRSFELSTFYLTCDLPITDRCCFFIPPENIRKPLDFLIFSGCVEKQHRAVMS